MQCFERVVSCLLGVGAIAEGKLECGATLCILGVQIVLAASRFTMRPAQTKVDKWMWALKSALDQGILRPGDAIKMAGRLSWGVTHMFKRIGRAMLRPIHDQKTRWWA